LKVVDNILKPVDRFLNSLTMYELVMWGLVSVLGVAALESLMGLTGYTALSIVTSSSVLVGAAVAAGWILWRLFGVASTRDSAIISGLILTLIMKPATTAMDYAWMALAAIIAMSSKYLVVIRDKQLFNPAAFALVVLGLAGYGASFWWVGSQSLLPVVLVLGLLVVHKIRRFHLFLPFLATGLITTFITRQGLTPASLISQTLISGPLLFMGTIMLVEPSTTPPTRTLRIAYGALVGVLTGLVFTVGPFYSTPELALIIGNIFAFAVNFKQRVRLHFRESQPVAADVYDFVFTPDRPFKFRPGQYLEWTLSHSHADSRGNRRYFTIASSPTEDVVRIGSRIDPQRSSSFKRALTALTPGATISATSLAGDFTLPSDPTGKLVFIAGGIGITPFRSIIKYLIDSHDHRDVTLFYTAQAADGFAYWQLFNDATAVGLKPHYVITGPNVPPGWQGLTGFLSADHITANVPDYKNATFFISGPNAMVVSYKHLLSDLGVPSGHVKTDYFPGY
jgi:ferredoxin-NADP reductase/Na+-transporting NADH:ubiquinone oxidoreductase subunit NqrB